MWNLLKQTSRSKRIRDYECDASKTGSCEQLAVHYAVVFDLIYPKTLYTATEGLHRFCN